MNKLHSPAVYYFGVFVIAYGSFLYGKHVLRQDDIENIAVTYTPTLKRNGTLHEVEPPVELTVEEDHTEYKQHNENIQPATIQSHVDSFIHEAQSVNTNYLTKNQIYDSVSSNTPVIGLYANTPPSTSVADKSSNTSNQNNDSYSIAADVITNQTRTTIAAEINGTEFLPDGSSQEDLFNSESKSPRVITIEDYRKADISCDANYDGGSSHAILMRNLKGC